MGDCTFVWAHGLGSSVAHEDAQGLFDWAPVYQVAKVVRYDARGHGETPAIQFDDRAYRWPAGVDDMLRAVESGPFVAGGAGMGCATALYTALRAPRRAHGLVLMTPPVAWEARAEEARRYEAAARMVEEHGVAAWLESLGDEVAPSWRESVLAMEEKVLPGLLRGAAVSDLPTREEVRSIVMPALVLARTGDPGHPVAVAEELADLLVLSELHVADKADSVRAWPGLVRDFLNGMCLWEEVS
ncbi:MAG: alpha/beta hydrolase [Actinomycetota bacterium]|nr:alpha/beta hydrolase [Actinomycetota bacterium]